MNFDNFVKRIVFLSTIFIATIGTKFFNTWQFPMLLVILVILVEIIYYKQNITNSQFYYNYKYI